MACAVVLGLIHAQMRAPRRWHSLDDPRRWVTVVPFIRLYHQPQDYNSWPTDESIYDMVQSEHARQRRGGAVLRAGEFHLVRQRQRRRPGGQAVDVVAQAQQLAVLAHGDDVAIERLMAHGPMPKPSCA